MWSSRDQRVATDEVRPHDRIAPKLLLSRPFDTLVENSFIEEKRRANIQASGSRNARRAVARLHCGPF
jgi:hypothetical protein